LKAAEGTSVAARIAVSDPASLSAHAPAISQRKAKGANSLAGTRPLLSELVEDQDPAT
jgi:hypothetical protein